MKYKRLKTVDRVTHTHTLLQSNKWSKGGSREHRDVVILPRDCE